jgi:hypothetical protein
MKNSDNQRMEGESHRFLLPAAETYWEAQR